MQLTGMVYVDVQINGVSVPFGNYNTLLVNQNVSVSLPTCRINLSDTANLFGKDLPVNDGTKLSVTVGDDNTEPRQINYVISGTPPRKTGLDNMASYFVHGILDAIPYIRANPQRGVQGNSVAAMQSIAQTMNFTLNNNCTTNDNMMWLPGRKTWAGFAGLLAHHGWVDETSALHTAVDNNRTLHFHNITQLFSQGQIKKIFYKGNPPATTNAPIMMIEDYRAENHSGLFNNTYGYGLRTPQVDVSTGAITKFSNVTATKINNTIDMSQFILGEIGSRGRLDIPRIFTGNTHQNFLAASHQNSRIKDTYSQVVYILVSQNSGLTLFDMVQLYIEVNGSSDDSVNGIYCVTAISTAVKGRTFKEKIQLTASGPQNQNNSLV